jgi:F-type H+-transporting ATPase subunit gamma
MAQKDTKKADEPAASANVEFEFSPEPKELLDELLPASVRVRLFQCFTDAAVSEQIARMVAMKAATDAAGDMIKMLTRQYNRARQTQITMELLDIIGGASALA